ncbi:SubName: Full=Probable MCA1-Metacaspase {ECO:0000313/EMBL:CCA70563.1} [Serendipita indica DSM 11827]|nr:SubName: Full=Probable MCA1-Metacaspase {ECO:0000313/EMBL:CCA70563.1} [Serendipita indica DSM 11827]
MFSWLQRRWKAARAWIRSHLGSQSLRNRQQRPERETPAHPLAGENGNAQESSFVDQKRLSVLEATDTVTTTIIAKQISRDAAQTHQDSDNLVYTTEPNRTNETDRTNDSLRTDDVNRADDVNHSAERSLFAVGNATGQRAVDGNATLAEQKLVSGLESVPEDESTAMAPAASSALPVVANGTAALDDVAAPVRSPKKRAVLIGINYRAHIVKDWPELDTPGNDVKKMEAFLKSRGYTEMLILLDEDAYPQPTANVVRDALKWLVEDARDGDKLFLHCKFYQNLSGFSNISTDAGHGHQVPNETQSEVDGMDEAIVPLCLEGDEETYITDNELHELLVKSIPSGCSLITVFDCCHAGTMLDLPKEFPPTFTERLVKTLPLLKSSSLVRNHIHQRRLTLDDPIYAKKEFRLREDTDVRVKAAVSQRKAAAMEKERTSRFIKAKGARRVSINPSRQRTSNLLKLPETKMNDATGISAMHYGVPMKKMQTPQSTLDMPSPISPAQKANGTRISFEQPTPLAKTPTYGSMKSATSAKRYFFDKWLVGSVHPENMTSPIDDETISQPTSAAPANTTVLLTPHPELRRSVVPKATMKERASTLHAFTPSDEPTMDIQPDVTSVAACLDSEEAIEKTDLGGILTNVFIQCFEERSKEHDDSITLGELSDYLREHFKKHTDSLHEDCEKGPAGTTRCLGPNCLLPIVPPEPLVTSNNHLYRDKVISI